MAATLSNIAGRSEPYADVLAVYLPVSGSVNDVKLAYDRTILGPVLNVNDGGVGIWIITFTNNFPALGNLIVTGVSENDGAASGDFFTNLDIAIAGAVLTVHIYATNVDVGGVVTIPLRDNSAWVKIQKSVF